MPRKPRATHPLVIRTSYLLSAAALFLIGCGAPPRTPGPPGETLVLLENRVEGPCELTWADARIDNRPLDRVVITPAGAKAAPLDRPILKRGQHEVAISASAVCPGKKVNEQPAVLTVTQPVYMADRVGQITVTLENDSSAASGLKISFAIVGGHVLSPRADGGDVDCSNRAPVDRAICRTEAMLAQAKKEKDVVLAGCISEKLNEMKLLSETASPAPSRPDLLDPALRGANESSEKRVLALATQADRCVGNTGFAGDGMNIEKLPPNVPAFQ